MKLTYKYEIDRDVWCLLNYGKSSRNNPNPTKTYQELVLKYGENPNEDEVHTFIDEKVAEENINIPSLIEKFQNDWDTVETEYQKRADKIFGVTLPYGISIFLTINDRSPYRIEENLFFTSIYSYSSIKTAMHELLHFYTWYKYGIEWEPRIGANKYNDLKEAVTVLLNVEFKDLLPQGVYDGGYPQHQELRKEILEFWEKEKNMDKLWLHLVSK